MVDIAALLPVTSLSGVIGILINAVLVWIILMIVGKIIAKEASPKHTIVMALIALFLAPIVVGFVNLPGLISVYIIPLVVWIALGEVLLKGGSMKDKLKVVIIAFVIYVVLNLVGVPGMIAGALPV